jgi:laccase
VYRFRIVDQRGTLFYHAHISWLRATVHGAFIIRPKALVPYPFQSPVSEIPILIGKYKRKFVASISSRLATYYACPERSNQ